jgi:hypothetical protein
MVPKATRLVLLVLAVAAFCLCLSDARIAEAIDSGRRPERSGEALPPEGLNLIFSAPAWTLRHVSNCIVCKQDAAESTVQAQCS